MTATATGDFLSMAEAARWCPGHLHSSAVWRWATKGLAVRGGGRVYLEYVKVGARYYTTEPWLLEFFAECAGGDEQTRGLVRNRYDREPRS